MQVLMTKDFVFHTSESKDILPAVKGVARQKGLTLWAVNKIEKTTNSGGFVAHTSEGLMTVDTNQEYLYLAT